MILAKQNEILNYLRDNENRNDVAPDDEIQLLCLPVTSIAELLELDNILKESEAHRRKFVIIIDSVEIEYLYERHF